MAADAFLSMVHYSDQAGTSDVEGLPAGGAPTPLLMCHVGESAATTNVPLCLLFIIRIIFKRIAMDLVGPLDRLE